MAQQKNAISKQTKYSLIILCTVIALGLSGCGSDSNNNPTGPDPDPDPDPNAPDTTATDTTIVQAIGEHDDLSTLSQAIIDAGLEDSLEAEGPFTLLAPANSAFDNLPEGFGIDDLSQDQLETLISYHLIPSGMSSGELGEQESVQTVQESSVFIQASGEEIELNGGELHGGSTVTEADIKASNGIIHKINEVLLPDIFLDVLAIADKRYNLTKFVCGCTTGETGLQPILEDPDADITVFVPTDAAFAERNVDSIPSEELRDILEYHIVEEKILSSDMSDGQTLTTIRDDNAEITISVEDDGTISLDGGTAIVQEADLEGINGVVYIIDTVLTPPDN